MDLVWEDELDYTNGLATTFDDPVGAWGDIDQNSLGVSLPIAEAVEPGTMVEVFNPSTNKRITAPVVDRGPADWVIDRQGPTIDLTRGANDAIGGTGKTPVRWKVLGQNTGTPPGGLVWEDQAQEEGIPTMEEGLKILDYVDQEAPYMSRPRDESSISRIIVHGDVNEDDEALIQYGRQVDPERGFDPGYHFYIARDGTIKQGAPTFTITNHTKGENGDSIGINIAGADEGKMPTVEQEVAARRLISMLGNQFGIPSENVIGHGELQPDRRHGLEGGNIARDIRLGGYEGVPAEKAMPNNLIWEDELEGKDVATPKPGEYLVEVSPGSYERYDTKTGKRIGGAADSLPPIQEAAATAAPAPVSMQGQTKPQSLAEQALDLATPSISTAANAVEYGARFGQKLEEAGWDITRGFYGSVAAALKSERNPYIDEPKLAEKEFPAINKSISEEETKWNDPNFSPSVEDIDKLGYLRRRQDHARKALEGSKDEGIQGQLSRQAEAVEAAAAQRQAKAGEKWQPYINTLRDNEFGVQLVESIAQSIPSTAAAIANPVIGLSSMFLQTFGTAKKEYVETMAKKGIVLNQQEADMYAYQQALAQTPWEYFGDVAAARALKGIFKEITPKALESVESFGKWAGSAAKKLLPAMAGEAIITTPAQSVTQDIIAEKAGVQKPTTGPEKAGKAISQIPLAAAQTAVMFGAPASVVGGVKAARGDFSKPGITVEPKPKSEVPGDFDTKMAEAKAARMAAGTGSDFVDPSEGQLQRRYETFGDTTQVAAKEGEFVDEPTTDEELDNLQRRYEVFGAKSNVFRQSRSEIASRYEEITEEVESLSFDEVGKELEPIYEKYSEAFSKLGIETRIEPFAVFEAGVAFNPDGTIFAAINPDKVVVSSRLARELGLPRIEAAIGEEVIHAADLLGLRQEWNKTDKKSDFIEYVRGDSKSVIDGIRQQVAKTKGAEKTALLQAVADSWNLYTKDYDRERGADATTPGEKIFDEIDFYNTRMQFVAEFLRQTKQLETRGQISEEVSRSLWSRIGTWVKKAIDRVKAMLPGVREGKFGEAAKRRLERIDQILAGQSVASFGLQPPPPIRAVVNIGLATNDGKGITKEQAIDELKKWGVNVISSEVKQSETEPTLVATLNRELTPEEANEISKKLNQEAIAQKIGDKGELYGPGAENWKPFNPEYFLDPTKEELGTKKPRFIRSLNELEQLAKDNESFKNWYADFEKYLNDYLGDNKEYSPLLAEFIAATSPNQTVAGNAKKAVGAIKQFIEDGTLPHGLPAHTKNLERATRGEALSGPKVGQFSPAIFGDPNAITVDRHIAQLLFNVDIPTAQQIAAAKRRIIQIAERLGWTPRDAQAALWAANVRRKGREVQSYEKWLEKYRDELWSIFSKDKAGGGRGIQAARRIRERISQGAGSGGSVGRVFLATKPGPSKQVDKPIINRVISPIIGRSTSMEGKKSIHLLPVPPADPTRFYKRLSRVLKDSGFTTLGKAVEYNIDRWRKYVGKFSYPLRQWSKQVKGSKAKRAHEEFTEHWENKTPATSAEGKDLIGRTEKILGEIESINQRLRIPIKVGPNNFPASIKPEVMQVIKNPAHNPKAWTELMDAMAAEGIIPPGDEKAMLAHIDKFNDNLKQNGFFGEWNAAQNVRMPKKAYDYSFDSLRRFIISWSERAAQIEAFGKRGNDLWDRTYKEAGDQYTQRYIEGARKVAYNETAESGYARIIQGLSEFSTGAQLGLNPKSTLKNWLSGMAFNAQQFGVGGTIASLVDVRNTFRSIDDAYERGILLDDMLNIMHDGGQMFEQRSTATFASLSLRIGGFNAAESHVRGVSLMGAKAMLRAAIRAYDKNPIGIKSRQYLGYFQRLGLPAEDLVRENGKGELTDRFLRAAVNEIQGGYTYDQLPVFQSEPTGRFILKYRKWGTQQLEHFISEVVRPMVRGVTFRQLAMETVSITDPKTGSKEDYSVPGAFVPAIRYLFVLAAAGASAEWLLEQIFGIIPKTASIASVMKAWRQDKARSLGLLLEKAWGWHLQVGSMGLLSEYVQMGVDTAYGRPRTVLEPPGLDPIKQTITLGLDMLDQGKVGFRDVDQFMNKTWAAYRTGGQIAARVQDGGKDVFGAKFRKLDVVARMQEVSWLKAQTRRFNNEVGVKRRPRPPGGSYGKTEDSPFKDALYEDLLTGDANAARDRVREHTKTMSAERKTEEMRKIKASVLGRQPIRAGAGGGDPMRGNFLVWANKNLAPEEVARIKRLDRVYRSTAKNAGLMKDEEPDSKALEKAMRRIELMAEDE